MSLIFLAGRAEGCAALELDGPRVQKFCSRSIPLMRTNHYTASGTLGMTVAQADATGGESSHKRFARATEIIEGRLGPDFGQEQPAAFVERLLGDTQIKRP